MGTLTSTITSMDSQPISGLDAIDDKVQLKKIEQAYSLQDVKCDIVVIDSRIFMRECIKRSLEIAFSVGIEALSSIDDLKKQHNSALPRLIIISIADDTSQESLNALGLLSELAPSVPKIVLTSTYNLETMRSVISSGAKAYIPMSVGFEIATEVVRFVLAGGTYVPAECLLSPVPTAAPRSPRAAHGAVTSRELAVVKAIQQGKSNKIIAYDLNMCESTVKVHVRHIMKKLQAKNRTDVAIKAAQWPHESGLG
jgi:DNA-binding NarL/FixJ family response regulator